MKQIMLLLLAAACALAQPWSLSGRIYDRQSGLPLAGAQITVDSTRLGAISGDDGRFWLPRLPRARADLTVRLLGYETAHLTVAAEPPTSPAIALQPTVLPLQSILITASRTRELEWSPATAALKQQEILRRYTVQDIPVLLAELPSTTFYSESGNGIGYTYLNLRGFDQRRVSVLVNGVPQNDPEDHMVYWLDFPDLAANLEDIQVQRGAGSSFSSTPAIGGAINLITSNFTRRRGITLSSGYGTFNTRKYGLTASSGLVGERYAIYGRLSRISSDGYRDNSWVKLGSYFLGAARFDQNMTTQINAYGGPVSDHLAYYGVAAAALRDRTARKDNPIRRKEEIENFSQPHYELIHEWRLGRTTLNNTLFYVHGEGFFDYDGAWAPYSYYRITPANGFAITGNPDDLYITGALIHAYVMNDQYGWMPRAQIRHDRGVLTLGGEARLHRSLHYGTLKWGEGLPAGVTPDYRYYQYRGGKRMFSLYANEVFSLTKRLRLLGEATLVRHAYRLHDEKYIGTDFTVPYLFFNPRIGANYHFTPHWSGYLTLARTSREPRLKNLYDAAEASTPDSWGAPVRPQFALQNGHYDFTHPLVREESLYDLEAGGGYTTSSLALTTNVYHMEFQNEIVKSGRLDRFGQPVTGNARRTRHQGIELTGRAQLGPWWLVSGNLTWSRNTLVHHTQYTGEGAIRLDGNPIAGFPDLLANLRIAYHSSGWNLALAGRHVGAFYTTNLREADRRVGAATLADLNLSYTLERMPGVQSLSWQLTVTNLFDRLYAAGGEGEEFFPGATRSVYAGMNVEL
ncbi:MAG TPA: TonB-dependent receptor [bacterium]|nr:TonB-dependent receptor [bacterium]HPR89582.1 TonB-dependent receptor [bacterium]